MSEHVSERGVYLFIKSKKPNLTGAELRKPVMHKASKNLIVFLAFFCVSEGTRH